VRRCPTPHCLKSLAYDPVLSKCKLVAEAWDAGGLYQVGQSRLMDGGLNGMVSTATRFVVSSKATRALCLRSAARLQGSPDLYSYRGPTASLNFITCHDGFSLRDLVSYNYKHNEANGE